MSVLNAMTFFTSLSKQASIKFSDPITFVWINSKGSYSPAGTCLRAAACITKSILSVPSFFAFNSITSLLRPILKLATADAPTCRFPLVSILSLSVWVKEFPAVHLNAGREIRQYEGAGFKFRYLTITLRCYVEDNGDAVGALDALLEDIETVLEANDPLTYNDKNGGK